MKLFSFYICFLVSVWAWASPKGKLAYMMEKNGKKQIYVSELDGSLPFQVTSGSQWHLYPELSSNGKELVYVEGKDEKNLKIVLWIVGTNKYEIWTDTGRQYLHPDLSGDSNILAFSGPLGPNGSQRIGIIDLVSERKKPPRKITYENGRTIYEYGSKPFIVPSDSNCFFPALSSDGSLIAFQKNTGQSTKEIFLFDKNSNLTQKVSQSSMNMSPSFSFDDSLLAFTQKIDDQWDLFVTSPFNEDEPRQVTTSPFNDLSPAFMPNGNLVFSSNREGDFKIFQLSEDLKHKSEEAHLLISTPGGSLYAPSVSGDLTITQRRLPSIPGPARSSFGVAKNKKQVFVVGGHQGREHTYPPESFLSNLESYDLENDRWQTLPSRPHRAHGFSVISHDDYLYAFGGFSYSKDHKPSWKSIDAVDRYDISKQSWKSILKLPRARSSNIAIKYNDHVYLIGGWNSTPRFHGDHDGVFHAEIDVFNLSSETFISSETLLPNPLRRAFTGVVLRNEIIFLGGITQGGTHFDLLDHVTAFNPTTKSFRELPKLPFPTFAPAVGAINETLYMFGGMVKVGKEDYRYVNHIFALRPNQEKWVHVGRYLKENKGFSQVLEIFPNMLGILGGHTYLGELDFPVPTFETFSEHF